MAPPFLNQAPGPSCPHQPVGGGLWPDLLGAHAGDPGPGSITVDHESSEPSPLCSARSSLPPNDARPVRPYLLHDVAVLLPYLNLFANHSLQANTMPL